jgi:phosphatidate cytidylyltransferase
MDDLHSLNDAINKRAGRKLLPSIAVSVAILAIVFGALKLNPIFFAFFVWGAMLLAIREIVRAYKAGGIELSSLPLYLAATGILAATWFGKIEGLSVSLAVAIPNVMVYLLFVSPKDFVKRSTSAVFAIFYIPFLAGFILLLAHSHSPIPKIFTLVVLVSFNDTFAYFSGVLFGKHPMAPHISPKKTWEGLTGAIVATTIGAALVFVYVLDDYWWLGALVGVLGVITATCGDLIESAVKRDLQIKDMGTILPGHGGILDRVDSLLFTAPSVWFVFELIQHFKL